MHDNHGHHSHRHQHDHDHGGHGHPAHGPGHNHPHSHRAPVQWQAPHRSATDEHNREIPEPDLDKVEAAFVEGFLAASDQASFLRLARIPFRIALPGDGDLQLLRVEIDALTDVGSLTPHLGGDSFRYEPLPGELIAQRRRLRLVYFDGKGLRTMTFAAVRNLEIAGDRT